MTKTTMRRRLEGEEKESNSAERRANMPSLETARREAARCTACDLWKRATQTVFGEGREEARVIFVGEQPGDREDLEGKPFVGPAGKLFDRALKEAGIARTDVYVTNVVKHFKWELADRGKKRIHKKPKESEIQACLPWLEAEVKLVKPEVVVCLGATAAQALLGRSFRVTRQRGELIESKLAGRVMATIHPSAIIRAPDKIARDAQMKSFVEDLQKVARILNHREKSHKPAA